MSNIVMFVFLTSPGVPNDENIEMVQIDPNENSENVLNATTVQIANADDTAEEENTGSLKHLLKEIKQYFNWSDFFFGLIFGLFELPKLLKKATIIGKLIC